MIPTETLNIKQFQTLNRKTLVNEQEIVDFKHSAGYKKSQIDLSQILLWFFGICGWQGVRKAASAGAKAWAADLWRILRKANAECFFRFETLQVIKDRKLNLS